MLIATQLHARFHLAATGLVVACAVGFGVSRTEALALALALALVWTAEALNTALELLVDLVHPAWDARAGRVKDVAAGAVLLASLGALAVGVFVFGPHLARVVGGG